MNKIWENEILIVTSFLCLLVTLFLLTAASSKLFDRDEPRFARATVEMVQSGNYLVPTFNGELRPDKPILIYWLTSLSMRLMGQTELAFRFFAPMAVALTSLLAYFLGRRFLGTRAGILAMVMIPATPLMLMVGTAATTDAVLLAFVTLSIFISYQAFPKGLSWPHAFLLGLSLGAALLTKGPVGLAIPGLTIITAIFLSRGIKPRSKKFFWPLVLAFVFGIFIFCLWAVPADQATGGEFLSRGLKHHVGSRVVTSFESHGGNFFSYLPYYLVVILVGFFPWILYLPAGLSALFGDRLGKNGVRPCLLAWLLPTLVLMTLVTTKLPHYILPLWPALALVSAGVIHTFDQKKLSRRDQRWLSLGPWFFVPIGLGISFGIMAVPWFTPLNNARGSIFSSGLILLIMVILGMREFRAKRHWSCATVLALGMILFQLNTTLFVLPSLNRYKVSPNIAQQIRAKTPEQVKVFMYEYNEPSLIFYLDRQPVQQLGSAKDVVAWTKTVEDGVLVIPRSVLEEIEKKYGPLGLTQIGVARGFSLGHGKWLELVALER